MLLVEVASESKNMLIVRSALGSLMGAFKQDTHQLSIENTDMGRTKELRKLHPKLISKPFSCVN